MSTDKSEIFTKNIVIALKETSKFGELGSPASSYFRCLVLGGWNSILHPVKIFSLISGWLILD